MSRLPLNMDTTVLTSLVAAGVSLASVAANLIIARKSHQSNLDALILKSRLDEASFATKALKELETETERLRIRAWMLLAALGNLERPDAEHMLAAGMQDRLIMSERLTRDIEALLNQADVFWDTWAPAKCEVPPASQYPIRTLRHDCRVSLQTCKGYCELIMESIKNGHGVNQRFVTHFRTGLTESMKYLDSLMGAVAALRQEAAKTPLVRQ